MTNGAADRRRLVTLTSDECWELAATAPVGRLAWSAQQGPTVIPVNFVVNGSSVLIRSTAYSDLGRECEDNPVAFEVDSFDPELREGWSVLMRGFAHFEYGSLDAEDADPDVWVSGPRTLRLRIDVTAVSGRRVRAD